MFSILFIYVSISLSPPPIPFYIVFIIITWLEMMNKYYKPVPQNEVEVRLDHIDRARAKARYCERENHLNTVPVKVGGEYVTLCPKCQPELTNHLEKVISRHTRSFKVIPK